MLGKGTLPLQAPRTCFFLSLCPPPVWPFVVVVQLLSCVQLFEIPWTAVCQASLSFTIFQSLLRLMSIESVMPSNHPIFCQHLLFCPQSVPTVGSFPMSHLFESGGQSTGASTFASVLPMNISVQFSSVAQSCPTLCAPMNCSTPGLPVHHQLPEFTQTHVHQLRDAIQPSHPLSSPSPPASNPSQHQSLFQ